MIKKAFDANGIKFAFPTVQIAADGEPSADATAAVAHRALELTKPPRRSQEKTDEDILAKSIGTIAGLDRRAGT